MALFQNSVITKHLQSLDQKLLDLKWNDFAAVFHNTEKQTNIRNSKEEQYQEGFLRELLVNVLGYTINPDVNFNLLTEQKNETNSKKADGAIIIDGKIKAVIELKGTDTSDLGKIETQAFGYKNNQTECVYVITSNFEKLRFYIDNAVDFIEFNLFTLTKQEFQLLYICLSFENIKNNIPKHLKDESVSKENQITKKLYKDYSEFKRALYNNLVEKNPQIDKLLLFKKTQKLLDRFLFIFFAEDRQLVPTNLIRRINLEWENLKKMRIPVSLYDRYKTYFEDLNTGATVTLPAFGKKTGDAITAEFEIFAYNGGLFLPDEILDNVQIDDDILHKHSILLSDYDFDSDVDVNILGHIFENSLNEIDEIKSEIAGAEIDKTKTKRKKDGVFYTPKYITKYIVDNTIGKLCEEKKTEFEIIDEEFAKGRKNRNKSTIQKLDKSLHDYRDWLLQITICDPACGSGAFLNQALEFLIQEHKYIDNLEAQLLGSSIGFPGAELHILENNIYGVDLNDESVEIAKLSLWLRTAQKGRKLNSLNNNIKCGNSLIDDVSVAGEKAFSWEKEFPEVFQSGGFDAIIGNPPYGAKLESAQIDFYRETYKTVIGHSEVYYIFSEKAIKDLTKENGYIGFIIPNAWLSNKYAMKLRELLLLKTCIKQLINFNKKIIFEDANVETAIFICANKIPENNIVMVGQTLDFLYDFNQNDWLNNSNHLISFAEDNKIDKILKKVGGCKFRLSDKLDVSNGFKPYQVGYGQNLANEPLNANDVNSRIFHFDSNVTGAYKKEIKGKGVGRYNFKWEESYINWGKWLMSPKSSHYFEQPKILLRQVISDYLFAYLDNEKYYADQSLYVCTKFKDKQKENLEFYLCLLNSKLIGFYFRKFYSEEDDLFPKIKVNELKNIPVPDISIQKQFPLLNKGSYMQIAYKELQASTRKFSIYFSKQYKIEKISGKLEKWFDLEFTDFVKELNKSIKTVGGTPLTKKDEFEWMDLFEENKKKAIELKSEIDKTDKEIDQMVYALYGLTEEEIKIVEGL
jgi:type I restriction-modification system DNA methylase subunit